MTNKVISEGVAEQSSNPASEVVEVSIDNIIVDLKYQTRVKGLNKKTVKEYQKIYDESPERMPPIDIVRINEKPCLTAGFQRVEAAKRAGCESIRAIVKDGDEKTAMLEALGSNKHGLKLSNGDITKAIGMAIEAFSEYSNVRIAELVGCSESMVRKVLKNKEDSGSHGTNLDDKIVGKDGKRQARHKKAALANTVERSDETEGVVEDHDEATGNATEPSVTFEASDSIEPSVVEPQTTSVNPPNAGVPIGKSSEVPLILDSWNALLDRLASESDNLPSLFSEIVHGIYGRLTKPESQEKFLALIEDIWSKEEEDEVEPEPEMDEEDTPEEEDDSNWIEGDDDDSCDEDNYGEDEDNEDDYDDSDLELVYGRGSHEN